MSKASEWARTTRESQLDPWQPSVVTVHMCPRAYVHFDGVEYMVLEGLTGTTKLTGPLAVKLAHWIIATFGDE